ncbi:hypothetical protein ACR30L_15230 [Psychromonas sp. PT13]|uniref:hypothetical protein n=1 Tax=Psychromonas sp. PT13 TaxID=3439547 RepID=UPI003EB74CED
MTKINNIFQILGILATIFSTYLAYLTFTNDTDYSDASGVDVIKLKVANVVAPKGYTLTNPRINVIKKNSHFVVKEKDTAYLFQNERIPFSVKKGYDDKVFLLINGKGYYLGLGNTVKILNSDCILWLYSIESKHYSIELRCGKI